MENEPLVSIIMTAYNREQFISYAIKSVLASTYKDFELIIVDDCSKDNTFTIATSYAKIDSRVKVYSNKVNLGDYPNRNQAASFATGVYIKYLDSDDYIYPWGLEIMIKCMQQFPSAEWGLCSLPANDNTPFPIYLNQHQSYKYHYFGSGLFHKAPGSSIIKKELFNKVNGFETDRMSSDFEMWHNLGCHSGVVLMPDGIVWNRINLNHQSELSEYKKYILQYEGIKWKYLRSPLNPLSEREKKTLKKKFTTETLRFIIFSFVKFKFKTAIEYLSFIIKNYCN